jgi:hypothetical protein
MRITANHSHANRATAVGHQAGSRVFVRAAPRSSLAS